MPKYDIDIKSKIVYPIFCRKNNHYIVTNKTIGHEVILIIKMHHI